MFCRVHQWRLSRCMDSGSPPPARTADHLRRCPTCRRFVAQCVDMAETLTGEARDAPPVVGSDLHARIVAACRTDGPARAPRRTRRPVRAGSLAAAVALAAVGLCLALWPGPERPTPAGPADADTEPLVWLLSAGLSDAEPAAVADAALTWPVRRGTRLVADDGRAVVDLLLTPLAVGLGAGAEP